MYEPYDGEKTRFNFKEKFNKIKQKIQEKFKSLNPKEFNTEKAKFNKISITVLALALLLTVGSVTTYVSKTGKINNLEANNMVLQKQNDECQKQNTECQSELININDQLSTCLTNVETIQSDLTKMALNYQASQADLQSCNDEKLGISSDLNMVNDEHNKLKTSYDKLKSNYANLSDDLEYIACQSAKIKCGAVSNYYYLDEGKDIVCCWDLDTCKKEPVNEEKIETIDC